MLCVVINGENLEMFDRPNPKPGPTGVVVTVHSFGMLTVLEIAPLTVPLNW